jgi:hypothetical protein
MQKTQVYGVEQTIATLKTVEPELIKQARKDMRRAAEPIATSIESYIPNEAPLSGFRHRGRTSWQPNNVRATVRTDFTKRAFKREQSLVKIVVGGKKGTMGTAGLQIADMAGRKNKIKASGRTREFTRNGVQMSRRLSASGARNMVDYLTGRFSSPSRFVWRAAMMQLPGVQASVMNSLDKLSKEINQKLLVK